MNYFYQSTTISILFIFLWIFENQLPVAVHRHFPLIIVFFFIQSLVISWIFMRAKKKTETSIFYFLGATVFRLLTLIFLLGFFMVIKGQNFELLLFEIIGLYLVYLVFELRYVLINLQRN
tara:strand:- start:530 stop:889 length:360 start_codon:yes stop_codon:yes gene_type:complete